MNKTVTGIEHRGFSVEPGFFNDKLNLVVSLDLWSYTIGQGCKIALEPYGDQRFSELPPFDPFHNSCDYDIVREMVCDGKSIGNRRAISIRSSVIPNDNESCWYSNLVATVRPVSRDRSAIGNVVFYSLISKKTEHDSKSVALGEKHAERINYLKLAGILACIHTTQEWRLRKESFILQHSDLSLDTTV